MTGATADENESVKMEESSESGTGRVGMLSLFVDLLLVHRIHIHQPFVLLSNLNLYF